MKAFKKLASLVISLTMITSSLAFTIPASAAEIDDSSSQSANANLQSNVQDGVILHAFNWSYNAIKENLPAIAAAGYSTVQTSPVQQPKDYTVSADVSGQWWKLYQPVSMQIAQQSWLGTKAELTSLCAEADKYGIKIICDIVSNHMGNDKETDPSSLSPQIKTYQPDFYNNKSSYFHSYSGSVNDSSVQAVVQGHVSNAPDLNTSNSNVQDAVISLLKDCIDCGVDGFRFDAAKHIETPDDGSYASNYWSNVSSSAKSYYKQKTGKDLFIYGEILNTCGSGRSYGSYTKYINVTDNKTGDAVLANVDKSNASGAASSSYQSGQSASKLVLWAESHDTYEGDSGSASGYQNTAKVSNENVSKAWAIVAARKDATSLFFARPGSALMGEVSTDTTYKSTAVAEVNKFHNTFVGQSEKLGSSDGVAYVARGNGGIVLANCSGTTKNVSISGTGLANGTYTDTVSGNQFTVSGGTVSGKIGSTGIAVVYKASVTPRNTCSVESGSFRGDTMTVELGLDNATSGTYCLDDSTPVTYTGKTTIRIGSDYEYGETINLTLTATNGSDTETTTYHYLKNEDDGSGVYVFFNAKNRSSWTAPYNVYIYDEDSSSTITYKNASWPGQTMKYDSASGYYYVEVPKTCIATDKSGNVLPSTSFNLATSPKTYVIINASGKNQQYPGDGSSTKLALGGSSKLFAGTSAKSFTTTTLKPASTTVEATDVTKGTAAPTTEPTTTVPVTTAPAKYNYGDVDLNGSINIADSTIIQKYIAQSVTLSELQLILADVSQDEKVNVKDATLIQ
ncbi:MAG: alpha-amylase family glycosyl hydrolase, partial [Clostridia bacterium]|nr:alpha-amylase family glycosyl hydrolase [Clostridia bacterium]